MLCINGLSCNIVYLPFNLRKSDFVHKNDSSVKISNAIVCDCLVNVTWTMRSTLYKH